MRRRGFFGTLAGLCLAPLVAKEKAKGPCVGLTEYESGCLTDLEPGECEIGPSGRRTGTPPPHSRFKVPWMRKTVNYEFSFRLKS